MVCDCGAVDVLNVVTTGNNGTTELLYMQGSKANRTRCSPTPKSFFIRLVNKCCSAQEEIQVYKEAMGIDNSIRILCDLSYLEHICELLKGPAKTVNPHATIAKVFGVRHVSLRTTWCVFDDLTSKLKNTEDKDYKLFLEDVKAIALGINKHCSHVNNPINSWDCLKSFLEAEVIDPYFFGSTSDKRCRKTKKRYGLPVIAVQRDGMLTVKPPTKAQKKQLAALKEKRSTALKRKKDKTVDLETVADEYFRELKEAFVAVKRKRHGLKKTDRYRKYFNLAVAKQSELESKRKTTKMVGKAKISQT